MGIDFVTLALAKKYADSKTGQGSGVSVQSDWNQNDWDAPDYVNHRTHFTKAAGIVFEIPANETGSSYSGLDIDVDRTYYVYDTAGVEEPSEDFVLKSYGTIDGSYFKISDGGPTINNKGRSVYFRNTLDRPIVLYGRRFSKTIDSQYLPVPSEKNGTSVPGVVTTRCIPPTAEVSIDHIREVMSDVTGRAFCEKDIVYRTTFDLCNADFDGYAYGRKIVCEGVGSLSEQLLDVPASAYPVIITILTNGILIQAANGEAYSASGVNMDDGGNVIELVGLIRRTAFFAEKRESRLLYDEFGNYSGVKTYASLGLTEGQTYAVQYYGSGGGVLNLKAVYCESLDMIVCLSDNNIDVPTKNRFYIGDTQSYVNTSWYGAFGGYAGIDAIYEDVLYPSIPYGAIIDPPGASMEVTITATEDENGEWVFTADKTFIEILEALNSGMDVYAVSNGIKVAATYWNDGMVEFTHVNRSPDGPFLETNLSTLVGTPGDDSDVWQIFDNDYILADNRPIHINVDYFEGELSYSLNAPVEAIDEALRCGRIPDIYLASESELIRCISVAPGDDYLTLGFYSVMEGAAIKLMLHADGSVTEWMPM